MKSSPPVSLRRHPTWRFIAALLLAIPSARAASLSLSQSGTNSNWDTAGVWFTANADGTPTATPSPLPGIGDNVYLGFQPGFEDSVNYAIIDGPLLNSFTLDARRSSTFTFIQNTAGSVLRATTEDLGISTSGADYELLNGTDTVDALSVGNSGFGQATYHIGTGTTAKLNATTITVTSDFIPSSLASQIMQDGGVVTVSSSLRLATGGKTAIYALNDGYLNATSEVIGGGIDSLGVFSQTGGANSVSSSLSLGDRLGSHGIYNLSGNASLTAMVEYIGRAGDGVFNQSGGTNLVNNTLYLAAENDLVPLAGTYTLSGNGSLTAAKEVIGQEGYGTFIQTGGSHTVLGALAIGHSGHVTSTYTMDTSTGPSTLDVNGGLELGGTGDGTFTQNGGTVRVPNMLTIGSSLGSSFYTLNSGRLEVQNELVGVDSEGQFNQNGGTHVISNSLTLSSDMGTRGVYTLNGGDLMAVTESIGFDGLGTFTHTSGTNTVAGALLININYNANIVSSYALSGDGVLKAKSEVIGPFGEFDQSGGSNTVATTLLVSGAGQYNLSGGINTVTDSVLFDGVTRYTVAGRLLVNGGAHYTISGGTLNLSSVPGNNVIGVDSHFTQYAGTENGYLVNDGDFSFYGGTFNGTLENNGTLNIPTLFTAGGGLISNVNLYLSNGTAIYAGGIGFDNESEVTLSGGTIGGNGTFNNGVISGYGTINGWNLTNHSLISVSGGSLTLLAMGLNQSFGDIELNTGYQLRLKGSPLLNQGTLALNGSTVTGPGMLENSAGGVITGPGTITAPFANDAGGVVQISGGTLNISQPFTNGGLLFFLGVTANLSGGGLTNTGSIQGVGNIGSATLNNQGNVEAAGGTLAVNGTLTNTSSGQLYVDAGSKLFISTGLASNAGLIYLAGGTFDNNGRPLTNSGEISGYGSFRTGGAGLTNSGTATFTGGPTTVNGNVTNTGRITVAQTPATFTGNVTNAAGGVFKTTNTTVTFAGTFTNAGSYISDPSTQNFANLIIPTTGSLSGSVGDVFNVSGDVTNQSTQNTLFDIRSAKLTLQGSVTHQFTWTGADLGLNGSGYVDNFAIGIFEVQSGGHLNILDGNTTAGVGLYVGTLQLDGGLAQIADLTGNGANIYYDPAQAGNSYLGGGTYALQNGGSIQPLIPTPEPATTGLLLLGTALFLRRPAQRR